jgi:predicted ATPase
MFRGPGPPDPVRRSRGHYNLHAESLCDCLDLRWTAGPKPGSFFSAENFRHFAELVDAWAASDPGLFGYFGGSSLTEKSHGQCNMAFFASRYGVEGLYLLDEPESALSPLRQLELRDLIGRAASRGHAQFIMATHSLAVACRSQGRPARAAQVTDISPDGNTPATCSGGCLLA